MYSMSYLADKNMIEIYHLHKNYLLHSVRGQSGFFNLALTERNMQVKSDLKLSVYSLGLEI